MRIAWNKRDIKDIVGKTYNRLTVIKEVPSYFKSNERCVEAICECGVVKNYALAKLIHEHTKSCGCFNIDSLKKRRTVHGLYRHPLFRIWNSMRERCTNEKARAYRWYGALGVKVCDEWENDFLLFYNWCMGNGWVKGLHVDKDTKGDGMLYSPETCAIITRKQNIIERKVSTRVSYKGETKTTIEWGEIYGLKSSTVLYRIKHGWDIEEALTRPEKKKKISK